MQSDEGIILAALTTATRLLLAIDNESEAATEILAQTLASQTRDVGAVFAPVAAADAFATFWSAATDRAATLANQQQLYVLTAATRLQTWPPGRLREATVRDSERLIDWLMAFQHATFPLDAGDREASRIIIDSLLWRKDLFVWDDGRAGQPHPVSMAALARPTPNGIALNLVYTPTEARGRGYSTACLAALCQQHLNAGRLFCTLLAVGAGPTAQRLFTRVGFRPIANFAEYRFAARADSKG